MLIEDALPEVVLVGLLSAAGLPEVGLLVAVLLAGVPLMGALLTRVLGLVGLLIGVVGTLGRGLRGVAATAMLPQI